MPRYTAKAKVIQSTNEDTCRQFLERLDHLGIKAVVVSCPVYYYGKPHRLFEFQTDQKDFLIPGDAGIFELKRLEDKADTHKIFYQLKTPL